MDTRTKVIIIVSAIVILIIGVFTIRRKANKSKEVVNNTVENEQSYFGEKNKEDENKIIDELRKYNNYVEPEPLKLPSVDLQNEAVEIQIDEETKNQLKSMQNEVFEEKIPTLEDLQSKKR